MNPEAYYQEKLSANKLLSCYEAAPPRIKQYLDAEIKFLASQLKSKNQVLELGCGYGRVLKKVSQFIPQIIGNDISRISLELAMLHIGNYPNVAVFLMDASRMAFRPCTFDAIFCIQNGISAFGVNRKHLIAESVRVTKRNGIILFSSYSPKIWKTRLEWFRRQSQLGLIGEIDEEMTRDGTIVCKDGFQASTISNSQFLELFSEFGLNVSITEVDESSIFCKAIKKE